MSTPSFWGGNQVQPHTIFPLKATSFKELVTLLNIPHVIKAGREEFLSWDKKKRDAAKDGPYLCSVSFKDGTTLRSDKDADLILMVCLDIDDSELARDFVESPQALSDALWPFSHVAWTTANSTPENPRLRVLIPVDPVPALPETFRSFVRHGSGMLGLPRDWSGHRESNVLSQPAYRPAVFEGEDGSPIIACRTDGELMSLLDIPAHVEEEIKQTYAYQGDFGDEDLTDLPIKNLKVTDIRDALFRIDPDITYALWCKIAAGLRHNFRDEDDAEEAFLLYDEWSQTGSKYRDGDTLAKWKSFKPTFGTQRPTTIRTMLQLAVDAGWKPVKVIARCKANFKEWLDACTDPDVLMTEGHNQIAEVPFRSDMVEDRLIEMLRLRIKDTGGGTIAHAVVKTSVSKARRAVKAEQTVSNKPAWMLPWCYVRTIHKFYNSISGVTMTPEAFNLAYGKDLMPVNPDDEAARNGRPAIEPVYFLLNVHRHEQVDRVAYDPRKGSVSDPYFTVDGQRFVNEYRWSTVPAEDEKNAKKVEKAIRMHLALHFDPDTVERLIDWLAFLVQNPGYKIRWVPVIIGAQGSGKTFIASFLAAAIGEANVGEANSNTIKQGWNDWAVGKQLVKIEELWVSGKGRSEIYNAMKDILTNDFVVINQRNRDSYKVENTTSYVAFSNHYDPLPLEDSDRRWWIIHSSIRTEAQVIELTNRQIAGMPWFDYMALLLKQGGAIRFWLKGHKVRPSFLPNGNAPKTAARSQLIESTKNEVLRKIEDLIADRSHGLIQPDLIYYPALVDACAMESRNNHNPDHYLPGLGFEQVPGRHGINGSKGAIWTHRTRWDDGFGDVFEEVQQRYADIPDEII